MSCYIAHEEKLFSVQIYENKSCKWLSFAGNSALLPSDQCHRFCNVACSEILARNSFIVSFHVTSKYPMRACVFGKKFPAIKQQLL